MIDTVVVHDTTTLTDTLWVLQPHSWWRDTLPAAGALAAVVAALLAAYFAYRINVRLLRYNIAYGSYQRALVRLQSLKRSLEQIRDITMDVGMFLEALDKAAKVDDVDQIKFIQGARNRWKQQGERLHEAHARMFTTRDAVEAEYYGHLPVFPRLHEAVSAYSLKFLTDGLPIGALFTFLLLSQIRLEPFPLIESRTQLRDAKEKVFACLNDFERWYYELLELLRLQVFAGLAKVRRRPTKRLGGDPDALHLTLDGFKTASELGWYDPRLDTRPKKSAP